MDAQKAAALLPLFRSHKQVWAAPIEGVDDQGQITLRLDDHRTAIVQAEPDMFARYMPIGGDYYVVYADGYSAISPRAAFEEGYTMVEAQ